MRGAAAEGTPRKIPTVLSGCRGRWARRKLTAVNDPRAAKLYEKILPSVPGPAVPELKRESPPVQRLSTARKQPGRAGQEYARLPYLAKRAGLGISGALNGAITAAWLAEAGVTFFHPAVLATAMMIFGWSGGFIGVTIEPFVVRQKASRLTKTAHPCEALSAGGTLVANATAFIAAWLLLSHAAPTIPRAVAIGFWWLFGVTLQIAAGLLARLRAVDPEIA